ncbi:MAG: hypothetical protein HKO90_04555 [Flavobacteriaceae bacterium]|nr:hypothetical protein [Bacteroidia bacterium]NNK87532.1 hypothetical protein [Flavobacteriaceae bacterium]
MQFIYNIVFWIIQDVDIKEKISEAPDKGYAIGVLIGSYLPFIILVVAAYLIYRYSRKRMNED